MRTVRLIVAYDGTDYHGWQRQKGDLPTVQGTLEPLLSRILNHPVELTAAGRTDAGVHAVGQTAHFHTDGPIPADRIMAAANARLPTAISIRAADDAPAGFHATHSALGKLYRYTVHCAAEPPLPQRARYVWHRRPPLDLEAMTAAAARLVGRHDFSAFEGAGAERLTKVRTIFRLEAVRAGDEVSFDVEGDGFLYNMVRNIVGTLLEVGRGRRPAEWVAEALASRDRTRAGPTAPPQGLCLMWVRYPPDSEIKPRPPPASASVDNSGPVADESGPAAASAPPPAD
jgi:tRNA pseudouridine38-40 synthase